MNEQIKMLKCSALGCTTNENSKINGKNIILFAFPTYDESLVKKWEENSNLVSQSLDKNKSELRLCQLHFGSNSFASDDKNALTPGAVPTIFEFNNKRRIKDKDKLDEIQEESPCKQRKSQENEEELLNVVTKPQKTDYQTKLKSETVINDEDIKSGENMPLSIIEQVQNNLNNKNGGTSSSSVFTKQIDMGKKVYRLIIRIDKVIEKRDYTKEITKVVEKEQEDIKPKTISSGIGIGSKNGGIIKPCSKTGCKLVKTTLNSKPVFQCERCNKYYIVKESKSDVKDWTCYICQEVLSSPDSLSFHIRKHFTCDMCQAQCSTQISYDKHLRLHVSTDPLLPYKCHKCPNIFEVKADVRQHYADNHTKITKQDRVINKKQSPNQVLFRCQYCYAVFKKEQAYKSHVELHMGDGEFDCALCTKRFKTAKHLAAHQARHLGTLKYTCRVCSKEFTSLDAVENHMKTHMETVREEHKCNICKKIFKNESVLNSHMRGHLSRAHRCPSCHKAFINKTTLRIHFKTHSKDATSNSSTNRDLNVNKKHTCTLCPSTFDSRSRLYNHIMTHLEQMHGSEGGDVVFDGLNELLETDEDVLS